jgi:hypothetical protein
MPVETIIKTAQDMSQQNDRYLFIVVILILGGGMLLGTRMVARYFIQQHQELVTDFRAERKVNADSLRDVNEGRINTLKQFNLDREKEHAEFVRCVSASTTAIEANSKILVIVSERINNCPARQE